MKKQFYAITLLLSFLVVLSHQVISHHHHDTQAYDLTKPHVHEDEQNDKHQHHDSRDEENSKKDSNKDHNHPLHNHIFATNDFDCTRTNIQESNTSIHSIRIITVLCLFHSDYSRTQDLTYYTHGDPPFLIHSLSEPGAIALRGPPFIV